MLRFNGSARSARQPGPKTNALAASPKPDVETPWRNTAYLSLQRAAHVLGISVASLYRLENEKSLQFHRLAGRTLVKTTGVVALADADEPWTPSRLGEAARKARAERARTSWQEAADVAP